MQVEITFKGPDKANLAAQAAAFFGGAAATVNATKAPKATKAAAAPAPAPEAIEEDLLAADETGDADLLAESEDELSFDAVVEAEDELADAPANAKSTPAKNAAAKTAKAPKVTIKEVNAALVNFMKVTKKSKAEVTALLKKSFKVESVSELKESDYSKLIAAVTPKSK